MAGIAPFSIYRTELGPWVNRRREWKALGLGGAAGREDVELYRLPGNFGGTGYGVNPSVFDPVLAESDYHWYCPPGGAILDPFAGGAVRGLVAGNGGYRYTGVDLSPGQVAVNRDTADDWRSRDLLAADPDWITGDAADILPELPTGGFDHVFTCPPYYDLEVYSDDPADLSAMSWDDFKVAYEAIIAESVRCLADDRFSTWVVGEVRDRAGMIRGLVQHTIAAHERAGARLYNDGILMNTIGTMAMRLPAQWNRSRKFGRIHQYVLTFVKGDPRRAAEAVAKDAEAASRGLGPLTLEVSH
ncbi:class I SAM-dependent methyltransferase [Kitasatospora purpeofusca]|uniref:class I SAM-dependent methyltransferase n=1 Tax=Kitasatospora purpeofusca TaxID=67352 RepID=UPI003819C379